jgi:hypothetical protein
MRAEGPCVLPAKGNALVIGSPPRDNSSVLNHPSAQRASNSSLIRSALTALEGQLRDHREMVRRIPAVATVSEDFCVEDPGVG